MRTIAAAISKSSLKFLEPLSLEETYKAIVSEAIKLVKADYGSMILNYRGVLKRVYSSSSMFYRLKIRKEGFTYKAFKSKTPLAVNYSRIAKINPAAKKMGVKSNIFIPLSNKSKPIGILTLGFFKKKYFKKNELNILKLFGSTANIAIRKAQLYRELEKSLEIRDLFISMAAHELRTPLTIISGYVQLLNQKLSGKSSAESRWANELLVETKRMAQLINEFLEINRIRTGQLNYSLKECSLSEIIKRALTSFSFTYPNRKVIYIDKLNNRHDLVIGDAGKLKQVLINILENAAKFSPLGTPIVLTLVKKSRYFKITLADHGVGIAKKELPKIGKGIYQKPKNSESGMGLGLFLVKNIIEIHRGLFKIRSRLNQGTTVEIQLPKAKFRKN